MRYFYEMRVGQPSYISTENIKKMCKEELAFMIYNRVMEEAEVKLNPEGTCARAFWEPNVYCHNGWEELEWPT